MAVCRFSFSTVSTFEDRIFPHSTGLRPLPGLLPCYLRNHQWQLTNNNSEAGQGYCCPYDASLRLFFLFFEKNPFFAHFASLGVFFLGLERNRGGGGSIRIELIFVALAILELEANKE